MPFIPAGFEPPRRYISSRLTLEVLSPIYAEQDYACVSASRPAMRKVFGHDQGWLSDAWTYAQNRADLVRHEQEFDTREAFAYAVFEHVGGQATQLGYAGCLYIKPVRARSAYDRRPSLFDAHAFCWFATATADPQFGTLAADELIQWIADRWPFAAVAFPGRTISGSDWEALAGRDADSAADGETNGMSA